MASFFQSIGSFFAPKASTSRAGSSRQTLSYTHDAFTLPTHSPISSMPDSLNQTRAADANAFRYPPATPGTADDAFSPYNSSDVLNRSSQQPLNSSLLPMYKPRSASLLHPPLDKTWERIRNWLALEYPELGDTLNYGILPEALSEIELNFGFPLPRAVRESYLVVDGQEAESSAGCSEGLFFGLTFLPLEDVLEEWRFWREVDEDPSTGANPQVLEAMFSIPDGWIRKQYSSRGWIPLVTDKAGNYIGIDLNPPERPIKADGTEGMGGSSGQVIVFGRDFDTKIVLWRGDGESGWARWLASFADELESGEGFEVRGSDNDKDGSDDDSEDSVGYEGYFYSGAGGGKGGDAGSGGSMRFTGDYKGWSAIEVWADRSYKRWHAAGLVPDADNTDEQPKASTSGPSTSSTMPATSSPPALILDPTPVPHSEENLLDSATPTALVAPASVPSTLNSSSSQSTTTSTSSPLLPRPTKSTTIPVSKTTDSEDLMSLASPPPPSSWTPPQSLSKSRPDSQPPTNLSEPLVPVSTSPSTSISSTVISSSTLVNPVPILPPPPTAGDKVDLLTSDDKDSTTVRLVGAQAASSSVAVPKKEEEEEEEDDDDDDEDDDDDDDEEEDDDDEEDGEEDDDDEEDGEDDDDDDDEESEEESEEEAEEVPTVNAPADKVAAKKTEHTA